MNLKQKSDAVLIADLKEMVSRERKLQTEILHYLREIYDRQLYLQRGYSSLFAFCMEELGYSEATAQRRIETMKLIKEIPQVEEKIEAGTLSLSVASQIQSFIRKEEKKRKEENQAQFTREEKLELVKELEGTSARVCEKKLSEIAPETKIPREKTKVLTDAKTLIQFVADKKLMAKIERLKTLLAHQNINGRYDQLFEKVVDMALKKLDPSMRVERREKREGKLHEKKQANLLPTSEVKFSEKQQAKSISTSEVKSNGRYIPQKVRDQVWKRDRGVCQFKDPETGKGCGSTHLLEVDHRFPYAFGGDHSIGNLQLLCRCHNQYRAEKVFGETKIQR
jgi:hypothetical protein